MKARARADLCLVSGSSSLPAHQTWINVGFVVEVVNYSLKQLLGTNKALSLHEGKLQEVSGCFPGRLLQSLLTLFAAGRRVRCRYRVAVKRE